MSKIIEELYENEAADYVSVNGGDESVLEGFSDGYHAGFEAAEDFYGITRGQRLSSALTEQPEADDD